MMERRIDTADATNRDRALTRREVETLQWAVYKQRRKDSGRSTKAWTVSDDAHLRRAILLRESVAVIAMFFGVSERAVWRRMYKLGIKRGDAKARVNRLAKGANAHDRRER